MTKAHVRDEADSRVLEAARVVERFTKEDPKRLPLARAILDDCVRVSMLAHSKRWNLGVRLHMASLLIRANLMTEALRAPLQ